MSPGLELEQMVTYYHPISWLYPDRSSSSDAPHPLSSWSRERTVSVVVYPIPVMFLGVVQGWSAVFSFSRHAVLNPCLQYLSNPSNSLCLHGVTSVRYLKFLTVLTENIVITCFGSSRWPWVDSFVRSVLSYTRSLGAYMLSLGVAQRPRYHTDSDSGTMWRSLSLYVKSSMITLLSSIPSTVICFFFIVFTGFPLHSSNSLIAFSSVCIPPLFRISDRHVSTYLSGPH